MNKIVNIHISHQEGKIISNQNLNKYFEKYLPSHDAIFDIPDFSYFLDFRSHPSKNTEWSVKIKKLRQSFVLGFKFIFLIIIIS